MDDPTTENVTEGFGLMGYGARMYDPALGRFTSADTPSTSSGQRIIPSTQGAQGWDRYAYVNNNPVRYSDPTGHYLYCYVALVGVAFVATVAYVADPNVRVSIDMLGQNLGYELERWQ